MLRVLFARSTPPDFSRNTWPVSAAVLGPIIGGRSITSPEAFSLNQVQSPLRVDSHAIIAPCLLGGDQPVEHVVDDALRIARIWIAEAAATRQCQTYRVARRHGLPPFWPDATA